MPITCFSHCGLLCCSSDFDAPTISPDQLHFLMMHDAETPETLKTLMGRGVRKVRLVEMLPRLGHDIGLSTRWVALKKLGFYGVEPFTGTELVGINEQGGMCRDKDGTTRLIEADTIVLAVGSKAENALYEDLKTKYGDKVRALGDAKKARTASEAIEDGFKAAAAL